MYGIRQKYQNNRLNKYDLGRSSSNTAVLETKIEKPNLIKIPERKAYEYNNRYGGMINEPGRASAIFSLKRDNDFNVTPSIGQSMLNNEKDTNKNNHATKTIKYSGKTNVSTNLPNNTNFRWSVAQPKIEKEPMKWRRNYGNTNIEEEKPKLENTIKIDKIVKEEKVQNTPYMVNTSTITTTTIIENKDDKKDPEIKTTITVTKTENEIPDNNEDKIDNKVEKIVYNYDREKLGLNKTDDDLPLNKKDNKEEVIVTAKKRLTLDNTPNSTNLIEDNFVNKNDDQKKDDLRNKVNKNENKDNVENKNNKYQTTEIKKTTIIKEKPINDKRKELNKTEKKEKNNKLKIALNEIEKASAKKLLKENLVELFEKILDYNLEFKDEIFFKNLKDTERKVGNMDDKPIPHTYKEIETSKVIRNIPSAEDLLKKYTFRARRIVEED